MVLRGFFIVLFVSTASALFFGPPARVSCTKLPHVTIVTSLSPPRLAGLTETARALAELLVRVGGPTYCSSSQPVPGRGLQLFLEGNYYPNYCDCDSVFCVWHPTSSVLCPALCAMCPGSCILGPVFWVLECVSCILCPSYCVVRPESHEGSKPL